MPEIERIFDKSVFMFFSIKILRFFNNQRKNKKIF